VVVLLEVAALVSIGRHAVVADPVAIGRDRDVGDAVARVVREPALLSRGGIELPETRHRGGWIARTHRELLVLTRAIVAVDRIRRHEVDALAVGRPLPGADAGGVTGPLRGVRRVGAPEVGDTDGVDLVVPAAARCVDERLAVLAE